MDRTVVIGLSVAIGLLGSGIIVIALAAFAGMSAIPALMALALADFIIIAVGYIAIRRSFDN
jgi:hypothetical protein